MIRLLLVFLPLIAAASVWSYKNKTAVIRHVLWLVPTVHFLLTALVGLKSESDVEIGMLSQWLRIDRIGYSFLFLTSLTFMLVVIHASRWVLAENEALETREHPEGLLKMHVFASCLLAFEAMMTLVILAADFGLLWVAVEATTLVSAPLILYHKSARSIEAMWKYLLICSVGIGLALFGTMLLAAAMPAGADGLTIVNVGALRSMLDPKWFRAAFIFVLAGYGTKMGLAPFHTWLPDAHSESPGAVSALLSGALLNCSLLGIIRFYDVAPVYLKPFCGQLLIALGVLSLVVAAFFTVRQTDFKRLLAYSSIEHMGLLAIFAATPVLRDTAILHVYGHSLIKMALFLVAGNLLLACGTRRTDLLGGLAKRLPRNGVLFLGGILMICGMPPSPLFFTELKLVTALPPVLGAVVLLLLFIIFAAMTYSVLYLVTGSEGKVLPEEVTGKRAERLFWVPAIMLVVALLLGVATLGTLF